MFENIANVFKKLGKKNKKQGNSSKDAAKERLHLVLMQDRANVSVDFLELMKQEIINVIKKYIDIDEKEIDVRLTNQENEDGTNGAPALYANIPILNIKNDARKIDNKDIENKKQENEEAKVEEKEEVKVEEVEAEVEEIKEEVEIEEEKEKEEIKNEQEQSETEEIKEENLGTTPDEVVEEKINAATIIAEVIEKNKENETQEYNKEEETEESSEKEEIKE